MISYRKKVVFSEYKYIYYYRPNNDQWWTKSDLDEFKNSVIKEIYFILQKMEKENRNQNDTLDDNISDISNNSISRNDSLQSLESLSSNSCFESVKTKKTWHTVYS